MVHQSNARWHCDSLSNGLPGVWVTFFNQKLVKPLQMSDSFDVSAGCF